MQWIKPKASHKLSKWYTTEVYYILSWIFTFIFAFPFPPFMYLSTYFETDSLIFLARPNEPVHLFLIHFPCDDLCAENVRKFEVSSLLCNEASSFCKSFSCSVLWPGFQSGKSICFSLDTNSTRGCEHWAERRGWRALMPAYLSQLHKLRQG